VFSEVPTDAPLAAAVRLMVSAPARSGAARVGSAAASAGVPVSLLLRRCHSRPAFEGPSLDAQIMQVTSLGAARAFDR
jgi:hypothetical protein